MCDILESENEDLTDNVFKEEFRDTLRKILSDRDYKIICARFGIECDKMTQKELARLYKMTHQNVQRIEKRIIKQLRLNHHMKQFNNDI